MPRYYRRRYTRTLVRPKKKWASNIKTFAETPTSGAYYFTLVENSVQTGSPTPTVVKCGNFKVSVDSTVTFSTVMTQNPVAVVFILYVPEGWPLNDLATLVTAHPEWIMATKTVGGNLASQTIMSLETLNMSSRLKRNLNSGDKVLMYFSFGSGNATGITLTGTVRYWTCAN